MFEKLATFVQLGIDVPGRQKVDRKQHYSTEGKYLNLSQIIPFEETVKWMTTPNMLMLLYPDM